MTRQQTLDGDFAEVIRLPRTGVTTTASELEELYFEEEMSVIDLAEHFDCSVSSVLRLCDMAGIVRRSHEEARELRSAKIRERDYADPEELERLHHEEGLRLSEIGELFGMTSTGISYWFQEHDIPTNGSGYEIPYFTLSYDAESGYGGYPVWGGCDGDYIPVHRLVLVAEGEDPAKVFGNNEYNVHHRNGHKCDNRPSNLELVHRQKHGRKHSTAGRFTKKWTDDDILSVIRLMLNPLEFCD